MILKKYYWGKNILVHNLGVAIFCHAFKAQYFQHKSRVIQGNRWCKPGSISLVHSYFMNGGECKILAGWSKAVKSVESHNWA